MKKYIHYLISALSGGLIGSIVGCPKMILVAPLLFIACLNCAFSSEK